MKILLLVILSLLAIGPLILYQGQKGIIRMHDEGQKDKIQMHDDAKSLKEEVLQKVPIGSSIQDAKPIMEENGFRCEMYKNGSFYETQENDPEGKGKIYHENADFLLCAKEGKPFQYVFREWRVIIVHKNDNDVVSDIFVRTWVTGPQLTITNYDGWHRVIAEINRCETQINTTYQAIGQVIKANNRFTSGGRLTTFTTYSKGYPQLQQNDLLITLVRLNNLRSLAN